MDNLSIVADSTFGIDLADDAPEWAKGFSNGNKTSLSLIIELFANENRFGLCGNDKYVQIRVLQKDIDGLFEQLPQDLYPISKYEDFMESSSQMKKNHRYYNHVKHQITTVKLNRKAAKTLLNLFKNNQAVLEQYFIYEKGNEENFKSLDEDVIEKMFYTGTLRTRKMRIEKEHNDFKKEHDVKEYCTRRVSVLFSKQKGKRDPIFMKLSYFKDMKSVNEAGWLRLSFTYMTMQNGILTHLLPWEKRKEKKKRSVVVKINPKKRKRKDSANEEKVQKRRNKWLAIEQSLRKKYNQNAWFEH